MPYKFSTLPAIFINFAPACAADPAFKVTTQPDLALIDRSYPGDDEAAASLKPWERLTAYTKRLNSTAEKGIKYKLVYLTRHGVGDHNATNHKVGQKAWDETISKQDYYEGVLLADARLTDEGVAQAKELSNLWSTFLTHGAPFPTTLYSSPLTRCLQTSKYVFAPLCAQRNLLYHPTVKEFLRERMTGHTCDRRSTKSYIVKAFPEYVVEDGFTEEDELWQSDRWETLGEHMARKQVMLEEIWEGGVEGEVAVSLTCHSMAVAAVMRVCGMDEYRVQEGTSHALLVKGEWVEERPEWKGAEEKLDGL